MDNDKYYRDLLDEGVSKAYELGLEGEELKKYNLGLLAALAMEMVGNFVGDGEWDLMHDLNPLAEQMWKMSKEYYKRQDGRI